MDNNLNETEIILNQGSVEQSVGVTAEPSVVRGVDGFSPIATVTQEEDGARITITDINGTTSAIAKNGERGERGIQGERGERGEQGIQGIQGERGERGEQGIQGVAGADGFSPIATVTKTGDTATITITDKNGTTTASVTEPTAGTITSGSTGYATGGDVYDAISAMDEIVDLTPYFDMQTFTLDAGAVTPIIQEGGHMFSLNIDGGGTSGAIYFSGAIIADGRIHFTGLPLLTYSGTSYTMASYNLVFDATTGALDTSSLPDGPISFETTSWGALKNIGSLTITVGSNTYTYDGSEDVNITILDGENMGF